MIGKTNCGKSGGTQFGKSTFIVTAPQGCTITCFKDGKYTNGQKTGTNLDHDQEIWQFNNLENGLWSLQSSHPVLGVINFKQEITEFQVFYHTFTYRDIPNFSYDGEYEIVQDDDTPIGPKNSNTGEVFDNYRGNWKIRFLTSGNLKFLSMKKETLPIDITLVGGGGAGGWRNLSQNQAGGGGGGGHVVFSKSSDPFFCKINKTYPIQIGAGSTGDEAGGETFCFKLIATGGSSGTQSGGNGGNGGGGVSGNGGSGGLNGILPTGNRCGISENQNTREFNLPDSTPYAGGGAGGSPSKKGHGGAIGGGNPDQPGIANTGGGGGAIEEDNKIARTQGGSGIVIIRNHRL